MPRAADHEWVPLAVVGRPHGVRGELRAHPFNKDSALLLELDEILVRFKEGPRKGEEHEVSIDAARQGNDAILLKLHGVDSRDAADEVRSAELCARRGDFPAEAEGEFYAADVIGALVFDIEGNELGRVESFNSYPSVDILVVTTADKRLEVPLVDHYIESVDTVAGRVVIRTLEGLE